MEIELQKTGMRFYEKIFAAELTEEVSSETVVPDSLPDIERILCADGMLFLRSKECDNGMLTIGGTLKACVLYYPEGDGEVQNLGLEVPFQIKVERECITAQCTVSVILRLQGLEFNIVNSRKAAIRARVCADIECFLLKDFALSSHTDAGAEAELHLRNETAEIEMVGSVLEKAYVLTDEIPLTAGNAIARELIGQNAELLTEDVKKVGSKLVFKGLVRTSLLWRSESGSIEKTEWTSTFSQILETDSTEESFDTRIHLSLNGAQFDMYETSMDGRNVSAQFNVFAQALSTYRRQIEYVSDAYSNSYPIVLHYEDEQVFYKQELTELRDNMRGTIELQDPLLEVVQTTAKVGFASETENGFACPIQVGLLLRCENGALQYAERSFKAEWEFPDKGNCCLQNVTCRELYAAPVAGGVEVRILALAQAVSNQAIPVKLVSWIEADTENPINFAELPSVTVLPYRTDNLWELAKKYHSTVDLIQDSNAEINSSVLLIPKGR